MKKITVFGFFILVFLGVSAQEGTAVSLEQKPKDSIKSKKETPRDFQDLLATAHTDSLWLASIAEMIPLGEIASDLVEPIDHSDFKKDSIMSRLDLLDQKTIFNVAYHPSLESVIRTFLTDKRDLMQRVLDRSKYYFPLFEQELDAAGLPLEIKYLAIVESALNPQAKSRVGATGLWQFMYATGKMHKLSVSNYVDDRQDPVKSTKAAVAYLKQLYKIFGDWNLALAAYNSGPGNVNKAIRRSGGKKDFWAIRPFLPRETAGYVPAFMASMFIFEYAEELGFQNRAIDTPLYATDTIHVKNWINFEQVSRLAKVDIEKIKQLNPSYKLDIVPYVKGSDFSLRLPLEALGRFVANEDSIYSVIAAEFEANKPKSPMLVEAEAPLRYSVQSGDFLGKIAEKYGVYVSQIKRWNNLSSNTIKVGQRLLIYPRKFPKTTSSTTSSSNQKYYTVRSGDSLWSISKKFNGISFEDLKKWNAHLGPNIAVGTKVLLCNCTP